MRRRSVYFLLLFLFLFSCSDDDNPVDTEGDTPFSIHISDAASPENSYLWVHSIAGSTQEARSPQDTSQPHKTNAADESVQMIVLDISRYNDFLGFFNTWVAEDRERFEEQWDYSAGVSLSAAAANLQALGGSAYDYQGEYALQMDGESVAGEVNLPEGLYYLLLEAAPLGITDREFVETVIRVEAGKPVHHSISKNQQVSVVSGSVIDAEYDVPIGGVLLFTVQGTFTFTNSAGTFSVAIPSSGAKVHSLHTDYYAASLNAGGGDSQNLKFELKRRENAAGYIGLPFYDNFESGLSSGSWNTRDNVELSEENPYEGNFCMKLSAPYTFTRDFISLDGIDTLTIEFAMKVSQDTRDGFVLEMNDENKVNGINLRMKWHGGIELYNGAKRDTVWAAYVVDKWYHVRIEYSGEYRVYDTFIEGQQVTDNYATQSEEFGWPRSFRFRSGERDGLGWLDDVKIYSK